MQSTTLPLYMRLTIILITLVQVALAVVFIARPQAFPTLMGLPPAPAWTDWIFAQFGARCLGFAFGMLAVLRNPQANRSWLWAMIVVQIIDWVGTVLPLSAGTLNLSQVSTAPFLPVVFVAVLALALRRLSSQRAA